MDIQCSELPAMLAVLRLRIEPTGDHAYARLCFTPGGVPYFLVSWEDGSRWCFLVENWRLFMDAIDPMTRTVDNPRILATLLFTPPSGIQEAIQ